MESWAVDYFEVVNWETFQHYRDRDPLWIKVYRRLLENYTFSCLQDASKWHLVGIWLLAGRHKNRLPMDPKWIAREVQATTAVDLQSLIGSGFIQLVASASKTLASCEQSVVLETEKETEKEPPTPETGECAGFVRFWKEWPRNRRKVARAQCQRHWKRAGLEAEAEQIIAAVRS